MLGIIRVGDKTTSGGSVISGSTEWILNGLGAARLGDPVKCSAHGLTVIAEGNPDVCDVGVPVAFNGHRCACGCALITSLPDVTAF